PADLTDRSIATESPPPMRLGGHGAAGRAEVQRLSSSVLATSGRLRPSDEARRLERSSAAFEGEAQTPDLGQAVLAAGEVDRGQALVGAGAGVGTGADQGPDGVGVVVLGGAVEGGGPI